MSLMPGTRAFVPSAGTEPINYTPGAGRGATGFTTRADLGYSVSEPFGKPPPGYVPGRGRGATSFAGGISRDDTADERDLQDLADNGEINLENEQLFKDVEYDQEDRDADLVYEQIDLRMDERRKSFREVQLNQEIEKMRQERPTMQQQFASYKRNLANLSREDWESIPNIGDYSLKHKQTKRPATYIPAPDSLLYSTQASIQNLNSIGTATPLGISTPLGIMGGGISTPVGLKTPMSRSLGNMTSTPSASGSSTSINDLGEARGAVLSLTLDKVMDSVTGQTVVDPKGYLTDLNAMNIKSDIDIADVKKARTLLKSATTTNPNHAPGWIAAARLEELVGKFDAAREIIAEACHNCSENEDVWLEAARLEKPEYQKAILAKAIKKLPTSVKIWIDAANKETGDDRKRILRKALEYIPNSVRLWKEAVSLENEATAYIMLKRAVECVPDCIDLWLALARLCPYKEAQQVLNEARKRLPTNSEVWITAAKLEESNENNDMVIKIISRGLDNLSKRGVVHIRSNWLKHAKIAELSSFVVTAQAIIKATINLGVSEVNRKTTWLEDGSKFEEEKCIECARAIYKNALNECKTKKSLWLALAELEQRHGTPDSVQVTLVEAVKYCPKSEILWLMAAKQAWLQGNVQGAREILAAAFAQNENVEAISLAAVKLERVHNEHERARQLLQRSRTQCGTKRIWMQSIQLERQLGNYKAALDLVDQALLVHPTFDKLYMIAAHLQMESGNANDTLYILSKGCDQCPWSVHLWVLAIETLIDNEEWSRARAMAEIAKTRLRSILGNSLKQAQNDAVVVTRALSHSQVAKMALDASSGDADEHDPDLVKDFKNNVLQYCDLLWLKSIEIEQRANNHSSAHFLMSRALQELPDSGLLWSRAIFLEDKSSQNSMAVDALNKCPNSAMVVLSAAILFWRDKKILKARKWFQRAAMMDESIGNIWGEFLAFELECIVPIHHILTTDDVNRIKTLLNDATKAEPNRGYEYNKLAKHVENWCLTIPQKLYVYVKEHYPKIAIEAIKKLPGDVLSVLCHAQSKNE